MDVVTLALAKKYTDEHGGGGGGTSYTQGDGIKIQHNEISVKPKDNGGITVDSTGVQIDNTVVQQKLTAGTNVSIDNNVINATDTTYTAGEGINITSGEISTKDIFELTYIKGTGNTWTCDKQGSDIIDAYNNGKKFVFYAKISDSVYVCGGHYNVTSETVGDILYAFLFSVDGSRNIAISIQHRIPSASSGYSEMISVNFGDIILQPKLTQGSNITISGNTISATDTTYTAGNGIKISNGAISTKLKSNQGLAVDSNGLYVDKNTTLEIDTNNKLGLSEELQDTIKANTMIGTSSGSISTFTDGVDLPLNKLVVGIDSQSGVSECNLTRCGKNLAQLTYGNTVPSTSTGTMVSSYGWSSDFYKLDKTKNYVVSTTTSSRYIMFYDKNKAYLGYIVTYANGYVLNSNQYWTNAQYIKHRSDVSNSTPPDIQLEIGSTATDYEQYQGNTYNIQFPSGVTISNGSIDILNGVLTDDDLSETYNITPIAIRSLEGVNNVFADTGDIEELEYIQNSSRLSNIPDLPTTAGNYVLKVTVTSGVPSYEWVAES